MTPLMNFSTLFFSSSGQDLARRDFTINAMAVNVRARKLFDPFGGSKDVQDSILRAVGSAEGRLREDGLRTMRGYRFLDGKTGARTPDEELSRALKLAPTLLKPISRERIWAELRRILSGPRASMVLDRMADDGVLESLLDSSVKTGCRGLRAVAKLPFEQLPLWKDGLGSVTLDGEGMEGQNGHRDDPLVVNKPPAVAQRFTHLAVIDLEATCDDRRGFSPQEVIELPCVLIDVANGKEVDRFRTFVRPTVNPSLTDFCQKLTGITQADVDAAPLFPDALSQLNGWLESHNALGPGLLIASDGDWDLRSMMPKQCLLSEIDMPPYMHRSVEPLPAASHLTSMDRCGFVRHA